MRNVGVCNLAPNQHVHAHAHLLPTATLLHLQPDVAPSAASAAVAAAAVRHARAVAAGQHAAEAGQGSLFLGGLREREGRRQE